MSSSLKPSLYLPDKSFTTGQNASFQKQYFPSQQPIQSALHIHGFCIHGLTYHGSKIFGIKNSKKFQRAKLEFVGPSNYLHSIYIVFTTTYMFFIRYCKESRDDLKCIGGCMQILCKYWAILFKTFDLLSILVSTGDLQPISYGY